MWEGNSWPHRVRIRFRLMFYSLNIKMMISTLWSIPAQIALTSGKGYTEHSYESNAHTGTRVHAHTHTQSHCALYHNNTNHQIHRGSLLHTHVGLQFLYYMHWQRCTLYIVSYCIPVQRPIYRCRVRGMWFLWWSKNSTPTIRNVYTLIGNRG